MEESKKKNDDLQTDTNNIKKADLNNDNNDFNGELEERIEKELYKGRYIPKVKSKPVAKKEYHEYKPKKQKLGPVLIILLIFVCGGIFFFKEPLMKSIGNPNKASSYFSKFIETERGAAKVSSLTHDEIKYLCADENLVDKDAQKRIKEKHILYDNEIQMLTYYRGATAYLKKAYPNGGWKITKYMKARNGVTTMYGIYFKLKGVDSKCYFDKQDDGKMKIYDVNTSDTQDFMDDFVVDL